MKVSGKGTTYTGDRNAAGRTLTFELPADAASGIILNVTGTATVDAGTIIKVDDSAIVGGLNPNDQIVLIEATGISGSVTNMAVTTTGGETFYLNVVNNQCWQRCSNYCPTQTTKY